MKKYILVLLALVLVLTGCSSVKSNSLDDTNPMLGNSQVGEIPQEITSNPSANVDQMNENMNNNVGGATSCIHSVVHDGIEFDFSYHTIPGNLIQYVGDKEFDEWIETKESEIQELYDDGTAICPFTTIVDFVNKFNIPREVFEALNDNYFSSIYDYNLDAIYAGEEEAETYYTSERLQHILEKRTIRLMKMDLRTYVKQEDSNAITEWCAKKNATDWVFSDTTRTTVELNRSGISSEFEALYSQYSLAEFINEFDIPSSVVAASFDKWKHPDYTGTLNIEALCSIDDVALFTAVDPFEIDKNFIIREESQTIAQ